MGRGLTAGFSAGREHSEGGLGYPFPFLSLHTLYLFVSHADTQAPLKQRFSLSFFLLIHSLAHSIYSSISRSPYWTISIPCPIASSATYNFDQLIARFIPLNISSFLSPWLHEQDLEHIVKREQCTMIMGRLLLCLLLFCDNELISIPTIDNSYLKPFNDISYPTT